jgi:hypothetical protein
MPDVYVEAGEVKGAVDKKYLAPAQAEMKTAIANAVKKTKSGMTAVKPGDGKGILVNVLVGKLAQDGNNVTCSLIGELFELPAKKRFNPSGSASGKATVPGKIDPAVAGACVGKAVGELMDKVGPAIAGSQTAPASTGTVNTKSPLIYIAPFQVAYTKDPKAAPLALATRTTAAIAKMMDRKIQANPKRFTQDANAFKQGSGMPAYTIAITVDAVAFNATAKEMVATTKGYVAEHPSGNIRVPNAPGKATQQKMTKPPTDDEKVQLLVDAAEQGTESAINWILKSHP